MENGESMPVIDIYETTNTTELIEQNENVVVPQPSSVLNVSESLFVLASESQTNLSQSVEVPPLTSLNKIIDVDIERIFITQQIYDTVRKYNKTCYIDCELDHNMSDLPLSRMDEMMKENNIERPPVQVTSNDRGFYYIVNGRHRIARALILEHITITVEIIDNHTQKSGKVDYIISGGESNPGPVFSKMYNYITNNITTNVSLSSIEDKIHASLSSIYKHTSIALAFMNFYDRLTSIFASMRVGTFIMYDAATLPIKMISLLTDAYLLHQAVCNTYEIEMKKFFKPESFEKLMAATILTHMLPEPLKKIFTELPKFSSFKILDDATWIFDVFGFILSLPRRLFEVCCPNLELVRPLIDTLERMEELFPFSQSHKFHYKANNFITEYHKKNSLLSSVEFRERLLNFSKEYNKHYCKLELVSRVPAYLLNQKKLFSQIIKQALYVENRTRPEPVIIIFGGPPKTGKTVMSNRIQESFAAGGSSVYVHSPPSEGQKNFHDRYEGEDIYVIDDIGQKGVSQYSDLINFGSSTAYPLDCAEVDKKGMKFFISRLFLASTNNFKDIVTTPTCGITEKAALFRRVIYFNFENVSFDDGEYSGLLSVEKYDTKRKIWYRTDYFEAYDGNFEMLSIADYIIKEVKAKEDMFNQQKGGIQKFPKLIAESLNVKDMTKTGISESKKLFNYITSFMPSIEDIEECISKCTYKSAIVISLLGMAFLGIVATFCKNWKEEFPKETKLAQKHYTSGRTPVNKILSFVPEMYDDVFKTTPDFGNFSSLIRLERNTRFAEFLFERKGIQHKTMSTSVISGRYLFTVAHAMNLPKDSEVFVTVYNSPINVCYQSLKCIVEYTDMVDDICILRLPDNLPKYFGKLKFAKDGTNTNAILVTPGGAIRMRNVTKFDMSHEYYNESTDAQGHLCENDFGYDFHGAGMCGSLLVTEEGTLLGVHVAGSSTLDSDNYGASKIFKKKTHNVIEQYLNKDTKFSVELHKNSGDNEGSINKVFASAFTSTPDKSHLVRSLISDIYPHERKPANLKVPLSELTKKSWTIGKDVNIKALKFAKQYVSTIMPIGSKLDDSENINGNDVLNGIDKKTSCGYDFPGSKDNYIDFEKGTFKEDFSNKISKLEKEIIDGTYKWDSYYTEMKKDELRNVEKVDNPRAFKACQLPVTVLMRKYFGKTIGNTMLKKFSNGIMVGINPLSDDWQRLSTMLHSVGKNVLDGDYGAWDGSMLVQFQQELNEVIMSKQNGLNNDDKTIAEVMLGLVSYAPTISSNRVYIATHSLPSGCGLTAWYNSMINKMYSAYIYYILMTREERKPEISHYIRNIYQAVYGDDMLASVSDEMKDIFNGPAYAQVCNEMGLKFTPADKGDWTYTTRSLSECSFLKRDFKFHYKLNKLVAPLENKTMKSTLNYVSDSFRNHELTLTKMYNHQREAFLHYDDYEELLNNLIIAADKHDLIFIPLEDEYLIQLYKDGEYGDLLNLT